MWRELSLGIGLRAPGCGKHNTRSPLVGILKFHTELDSAIVRVLDLWSNSSQKVLFRFILLALADR